MNKKTATALSLSAVLGVSAAVGGGTYALFTDTETAPEQRIASGVIDLQAGETTIDPLGLSNLQPGDSRTNTVTFKNASSLDGIISLDFEVEDKSLECLENEREAEGLTDPAAACAGDLSDQITVDIVDDLGTDFAAISLNELDEVLGTALAKDATRTYTMTYTFQDIADTSSAQDVNNKAQSDEVTVLTTANLVQAQPAES